MAEPCHCAFCGLSNAQVSVMIAGPKFKNGWTPFICDQCVDICADIIQEARDKSDPSRVAERYQIAALAALHG